MEEPIRVLCADDNAIIAMAIEAAIEDEPDLTSAGIIHNADDLVGTVDRTGARIVLLDLRMPGRDPLEALADLRSCRPDVRVVVFSGFDDAASIGRAAQAGAWGYVSKDGSTDQVVAAIRRVVAGETAL